MISLCKTWLWETDRNYLLFLLASVFLGGAVIAVINFILTSFIKIKSADSL